MSRFMTKMAGIWLALWMAAAPASAQDAMAPDALARKVTDEVLALLRSDKDIQSGNTARVIDLVETKVLPHFDFLRMTRLAVGVNWRQASPEQQKALANEFRTLLVHTYASTIAAYRNQAIEVRPLRMEPTDTEVTVRSQINQPGGKPVTVDYRMEKGQDGWKVYDVVVADLSLVQNYRGSFESEVRRGGIDGLVKALAGKNRQLAAQKQAAAK